MSHRRCVLPNYVIAFQSFCFSLKNNKQVIRNWLADRLLTTWISFQQLNSHNFIAIYLRKMKKISVLSLIWFCFLNCEVKRDNKQWLLRWQQQRRRRRRRKKEATYRTCGNFINRLVYGRCIFWFCYLSAIQNTRHCHPFPLSCFLWSIELIFCLLFTHSLRIHHTMRCCCLLCFCSLEARYWLFNDINQYSHSTHTFRQIGIISKYS